MKKMSNLKWAALFAAVIALCLGVILVRGAAAKPGKYAEIRLNGELLRVLSLSGEYEIDIDCGCGTNRLRVENGRVAVIAADCPDKLCVKRGYIGSGAVPLVCLPHKLTVTVTGGGEVNAVTGSSKGGRAL